MNQKTPKRDRSEEWPQKSRRSELYVERVLGPGEGKRKYLAKPIPTDYVVAALFLPFIPAGITPNQVTIFRFVTIPFIVYLLLSEAYLYAAILFAISALSDAVDGAMARTRGQVTPWGIMFDPLADKLLIGTTALILITSQLGLFLAASIVLLELFLVVSVYSRYKGRAVPARTAGKIKMVLQCIGLILLFLYVIMGNPAFLLAAEYTLYGAILFAVISLFVYRSI
ncbi:MAG: CDP-alcohol phosphatidyltransferase family protein [bacterium]|nr:CDP-alcohol phosphatidyltransferase family protein [bacterium]